MTHEAWSASRRELWNVEREAFEPLAAGGRLTAWLAQFPLSFRDRPAARAHLAALREALAPAAWVLEVRHRSWYEPEALEFVRTLGCSLATLDLPASPDHPPVDVPSIGDLGYLRLHGRNAATWFDARVGRDAKYDHRYSAPEVAEISERARRLAAASGNLLVVANNHYGGKALAAAVELSARLKGRPVPAPATLLAAFPDLAPYVEVRGQRSLF